MVRQQPGANVGDAFAEVLMHDDSVETHVTDEVTCAVDVWATDVEVAMEERPGCILPSPVLYITGNVLNIKGIVLDGEQFTLVYPAVEEVDDSEEDEAASAGTSSEVPIIAGKGPEVRFRYEFTPAEKVHLVECGMMEPGFEIPGILTQNKLETMPIKCRFMTVRPDGEDSMPFVFAEIPSRFCIDTSASDCGYRMADYFKESAVMQKFSDMLVPAVEVEHSQEAAIEHMEDDLLAAYAATEIEEDKAKRAAEQDEAENGAHNGKVLSDNLEQQDGDEKDVLDDTVAKAGMDGPDAFEEPPADAWSSVELDADAVDGIAKAFMEGRSVDDAVMENSYDEKSRQQKIQRLRQRGMLEDDGSKKAEPAKSDAKAAPPISTAEDDESFGDDIFDSVMGKEMGA